MHHAVGMFGGRVNSEQFQSLSASVNEIMFRSGRHREHIAGANIMRFSSHDGFSRAFDKNQDLVYKLVDFPANVFTWKNTHQHHLGVSVCEQDLPKVIVFQSQLLDVLV